MIGYMMMIFVFVVNYNIIFFLCVDLKKCFNYYVV